MSTGCGSLGTAGGRRGATFFVNGCPMFDKLRRLAVDVEPGKRVAEHMPMSERALDARWRTRIAKAPLHRHHLSDPLDVPACQRQRAKPGWIDVGVPGR